MMQFPLTEKIEKADSTKHQPLLSVAMPVFNAGKFLRPAVLSIVNQTFTDWELLIMDDNSTDGSLEYIKDIRDRRIKIFKDGINKGIAFRLNQAIDLASGKYLARMDSDDISYPERFARQIEALRNNPHLDLVGVRSIAVSETGQVVGFLPYAVKHEELCNKPWWGFHLAHPTWMGKIEWFRAYRYVLPAPFISEDQEILLRSYTVSRFETLPQILFGYRIHRKAGFFRLFKMRWDILKFQSCYFIKSSKKHFVFLSFSAFLIRILKDLISLSMSSQQRFLLSNNRSLNIEEDEVLRWENVLKGLK